MPAGELLTGIVSRLRRRCGDDPTDGELLGRFARHRDEGSFAELVERHGRLVLGVARRHLADRQAAEDVVQATFLALARNTARLRRQPSLVNWLYTVALRQARTAARGRRRFVNALGRVPEPRSPADPLAEVSGRELVAIIDDELARLPARYRLPLLLCAVEGLSREEAARRLGWPAGSVKGRLERGRELLRARLAARGFTLPAVLAGLLSAGAAEAVPPALVRSVTRAATAVPTLGWLWPTLGVLLTSVGVGVGTGAAVWPTAQPDRPPAASAAQTSPPATKGPLAQLEAGRIPPYELKAAGDGDSAKGPHGLVAVLGSSRLKHLSFVSAVAFSRDGALLASVGSDAKVRLWDPKTGEEVRQLSARTVGDNSSDALGSVAFSPDGTTVAAGLQNSRGVFLWEVATGRELRVLQTDTTGCCLSFSPDGRLLAIGGARRVQVWDLEAGRPLHASPAFGEDTQQHFTTDYVTVAFRAGGKALLVGRPDGSMREWDIATAKPLRDLHEATGAGIQSLALSPSGRHLAAGTRGKTVRVWEVGSGKLLHTLTGHEHYVQAVAFDPTGTVLATGGLDGRVKTWDVDSGRLRLEFAASRTIGVESLAYSPDGKRLASAGLAAQLWDAETGRQALDPPGHLGAAKSLDFTPDGRSLVTGGSDGFVKVWDLATQGVTRSLDATTSGVNAVAVSRDGSYLAALSWGKRQILIWDLATGQMKRTTEAEGELGQELAFSPDGRWLAANCMSKAEGSVITLWDIPSGLPPRRIGPPGRSHAAFSSDSRKLIVASGWSLGRTKDVLEVWDVASVQRDSSLKAPAGLTGLQCVAVSPDGRTVALSGRSPDKQPVAKGVAVLWDLSAGREAKTLDLGREPASLMDFAADGRSLVTLGFRDTEARVWDPRDGKLRETIRLCEPGAFKVNAIRFAPDSRHFAAGMANGTVYIIRIQPPP